MSANALLFFHQGWTDIVNSLPLITWYSKRYRKLYVLLREDAWLLVQFYIRGTYNVVPIYVPKKLLDTVSWHRLVDIEHHKITHFELIAHYDPGRPDWDPYKGAYARRNALDDAPFERIFYEAYGIPYIERVNSFVLYRDPIAEEVAYDKLIKREPYICTHTNPDLQLFVKPEEGVDIVELNQSSPMFFDYIRILQHAKAIHVIDSVWAAVCYMIDAKYGLLETVPIYVYCHRDFSRMFTEPVKRPNWTIVMPSDAPIREEKKVLIPHGMHMAIQMFHLLNTTDAYRNAITALCLDRDLLLSYRNDMTDDNIRQYETFLQHLFAPLNCRVESCLSPTYTKAQYMSYEMIHPGPETRITPLRSLVDPSVELPSTPYLVLNTKFVPTAFLEDDQRMTIEALKAVKTTLYSVLNEIGIPVVLLGERAFDVCNEYMLHDIQMLYEDHKANLHKVIDKTYETSKGGIECLGETCAYLNSSVANLFLGNGGGIHLYASFPNTIQLGVFDRLLEKLPATAIETNPFHTLDSNVFLKQVVDKCTYLDTKGGQIS